MSVLSEYIESTREAFERDQSDGGKWPAAVERDGAGQYRLAQVAADWRSWSRALAHAATTAGYPVPPIAQWEQYAHAAEEVDLLRVQYLSAAQMYAQAAAFFSTAETASVKTASAHCVKAAVGVRRLLGYSYPEKGVCAP